ncbi:unnamed protein product [Malus baccata var. baccata]
MRFVYLIGLENRPFTKIAVMPLSKRKTIAFAPTMFSAKSTFFPSFVAPPLLRQCVAGTTKISTTDV